MAVASFAMDTLPIEIRNYMLGKNNSMQTNLDFIYLTSELFLIVGIVAAYVGLYLWKKWARILFIFILFFGFLVQLIGNSPAIISPLAEPFYITSYILSGVVICSIYFCEKIKTQFTKKGSTQHRGSEGQQGLSSFEK